MGTRRAAAMFCASTCVAAGTVGGCSLLTDLSDLTTAESAARPPEAATDDAATSSPEASADARPVSTGPYVPRYERSFAITNPSTSQALPAGYTACFRGKPSDIIGTGANRLRPDAADLRVFAGGIEVKRVIDLFPSGIVSLCFRLVSAIAPGATSSGYVVRYGDANATPPLPVESDVFDFFDGFDGTELAPRWLKLGAAVVAGGFVTFPKNAPSAITTTASTDGIPVDASLEVNVRVPNPASDGQLQDDAGTRFFYWFGFQHQGDFVANEPWSKFVARSKSTIEAEHKTTTGTCQSGCAEAAHPQTADAHVYKVDRAGAAVVLTYDTGATFTAEGPCGDQSIMLRNFLVASDLVVDWVRARPLVLPEPAPTVGPEVALGN